MKYFLLIALVVFAGLLQPMQAAMNRALGEHLGHPSLGALWNFVLGFSAMALLALIVFRVPVGDLAKVASAPKWALWGGLCGATIVLSFIVGVGPLGAALLVSLFIVGQMVGSVVLDHFGWLGLRAQPINAWRIGGLALLAIGVVMIERGGTAPG